MQCALQTIVDNGTIIFKSKHICAYADDIVLITRGPETLKDVFLELFTAAKKLGLEVNAEKTKYMVISPNEARRRRENITIANMTFENVESFVYLGAELNSANKISSEIQRRIMAANRAYFANIKLLKSRLLSRTTKIKVYKTLIRPVATYGAETWNISAADANKLRVFERKIIRRICGPVLEEREWRIRNNDEINELIENEDIVRFAKSQRLRWIGHVERMADTRMPKRIYKASMTGRRLQGRPRNRWKDEVEADLRKMDVRVWKRTAADRVQWREVVQQAKAHTEL